MTVGLSSEFAEVGLQDEGVVTLIFVGLPPPSEACGFYLVTLTVPLDRTRARPRGVHGEMLRG